METRKGWRNRDASAGEGVLALLEALRGGLGAQAVGLFDDDRAGDVGGPDATGPLDFWDSFGERPCSAVDWDSWYRELRREERVQTLCECPEKHHVSGFLIHRRWALLLVAPRAVPGSGAATIASALTALADRLPPAKSAAEREAVARYDETPHGPAASGAPSWWVRKPS